MSNDIDMDDIDREFRSPEVENQYSWVGWIIGAIIIFAAFKMFGNLGEYEGENAEFWFNAYDHLQGCVEMYAYSEDYEDLAYIKNCLK